MTRRPTRRTVLCAACAITVTSFAAAAHQTWTGCSFSWENGWSKLPRTSHGPRRLAKPNDRSGVPQATLRIQQVLGFDGPFEVWIAEGAENAMTLIENGRRQIIVDVNFLSRANREARTRWAAIQVLAHEIGHHLAMAENPHQSELQADYWSGRALRLLGSARNVASSSILVIGTSHDTPTHPNKFVRARMIERGWDDAGS